MYLISSGAHYGLLISFDKKNHRQEYCSNLESLSSGRPELFKNILRWR